MRQNPNKKFPSVENVKVTAAVLDGSRGHRRGSGDLMSHRVEASLRASNLFC